MPKIRDIENTKKNRFSDKSNPSQSGFNEILIADDTSHKPSGSKGHNSAKFIANPSQSVADGLSGKARSTKGKFISYSKKKVKCK